MKSHRELIEECLSGVTMKQIPAVLWRHFPVDDQHPVSLARAVVNYQRIYDFDLVKVTPASSYCLKDWGVQDEWRGDPEGTRDYTKAVIRVPEDWEKLNLLDPGRGYLAEQLQCLKMIVKELGEGTPVIQTIFNPLAQAKNLVGKGELVVHMRKHPDALHAGLKIIAESTVRFIQKIKEAEIAGTFYAVQHAQYNLLTESEYLAFGRPYDLQILDATRNFWFNMLHLHGTDIMFDQFLDYPIQAINWHDQETAPTLAQAKGVFDGILCGGLQRIQTLVLGTPAQIATEANAAIRNTGGRKFILGTGCVVPVTAPFGNLLAVKDSAAVSA